MKETLAKLISNILNPFVVSVTVILLVAFESTPSSIDAVKWIMVTVVFSILPVFIVIIALLRFKKLDSFFNNPREQRRSIYIFASLLGILSCGVLWYFKAPELLLAVFTAGLISVVVFMVINLFWKISLHTAFMAAASAVLIIVYGVITVWTVFFIPLVGWTRIALKQHSPAQVAVGGLLAAVIVIGVFWGFGQV